MVSMVRRSLARFSEELLKRLDSLKGSELEERDHIKKFNTLGKTPKWLNKELDACGQYKRWCIERIQKLLRRYRWYDVYNLIKKAKLKGRNLLVLAALVDSEDLLLKYVEDGTFNKEYVVNILTRELKISRDEAVGLVSGGSKESTSLSWVKWRFLPRSI